MPTTTRLFALVSKASLLIACAGWTRPTTAQDYVEPEYSVEPRSDEELLQQRQEELRSGLFVTQPAPETVLRPVERVPRELFGVVGPYPLQPSDLSALVFPSASEEERAALVEGMTFFTTPHSAAEGAGPAANQQFCLGCHTNSNELSPDSGLVTSISQVSRASRSTPTNFDFTAFDPATGGGRAADSDDAIYGTGRTASFTLFGDYAPATNEFDPLFDFGGFVQHTRPALEACLPEPILPIEMDPNLSGTPDANGVYPSGFRRSVGERAAPPYIGRGLMEAIPNADILAGEDASDALGGASSLAWIDAALGCTADCISGRHNEIPSEGNSSFVSGLGRFGLRANGGELLQFVIGGLQGELGLTSAINDQELEMPEVNRNRPGCVDPLPDTLEIPLSTPFSERNFLRNTAPPEFGAVLLALLRSEDPGLALDSQTPEGQVQRGAALFGVDIRAFANRMIAGKMPYEGDGRDPHAIDQADRQLDCVGCHTPVQRTGQSPADVGAPHLSYVWAPIFSDLLLHEGPVVAAERFAATPRDPWLVSRSPDADASYAVDSFDVSRSLADDTFSNFQAEANGREFRTAPLMALGRIGPPFLHDARVYLSERTVQSTPASTVTTNSEVTNAPLVVRDLPDALRAAIELHDLPVPDDAKTSPLQGGGCPAPAEGSVGQLSYGADPSSVVCPEYDSDTSREHRSEARASIARFRALSRSDQDALIAFLQQL